MCHTTYDKAKLKKCIVIKQNFDDMGTYFCPCYKNQKLNNLWDKKMM